MCHTGRFAIPVPHLPCFDQGCQLVVTTPVKDWGVGDLLDDLPHLQLQPVKLQIQILLLLLPYLLALALQRLEGTGSSPIPFVRKEHVQDGFFPLLLPGERAANKRLSFSSSNCTFHEVQVVWAACPFLGAIVSLLKKLKKVHCICLTPEADSEFFF